MLRTALLRIAVIGAVFAFMADVAPAQIRYIWPSGCLCEGHPTTNNECRVGETLEISCEDCLENDGPEKVLLVGLPLREPIWLPDHIGCTREPCSLNLQLIAKVACPWTVAIPNNPALIGGCIMVQCRQWFDAPDTPSGKCVILSGAIEICFEEPCPPEPAVCERD